MLSCEVVQWNCSVVGTQSSPHSCLWCAQVSQRPVATASVLQCLSITADNDPNMIQPVNTGSILSQVLSSHLSYSCSVLLISMPTLLYWTLQTETQSPFLLTNLFQNPLQHLIKLSKNAFNSAASLFLVSWTRQLKYETNTILVISSFNIASVVSREIWQLNVLTSQLLA